MSCKPICLLVFLLACSYGFFGQNCTEKCRDTCTGCNNENGVCDRGCHPGWRGNYCDRGRLPHRIRVFVVDKNVKSVERSIADICLVYHKQYTSV